ncbi:MAG: peptidoglycan bridge formation glycyltransferase FemA/FemB family protein [Anaerolineaceae bacterium]|nr:peptidoglycan bridge formation glycyltransferase FemA/FemB family protein [Anaerolineaceae bacterium]
MGNWRSIHSSAEWDQNLAEIPYAHTLQSWEWGEFKSRWGWSAVRLLWPQAGRPVAAAQVLARPIPPTPWQFMYVTKGPALDYADPNLADCVFNDLEQYAAANGALFIKIDPDVPRQFGEPEVDQPLAPVGQAILNMLDRRGWRFSPEQIQFRNTVLIDIRPDPDELLARMKSKWRYNIRLAQRSEVEVEVGTTANLPAFYRMYAETAQRDGFLIRPEAYYMDVWRSFIAVDQAELLLASVKGELVAGMILFFLNQSAWYMYGASTEQHRKSMPNHLLQWTAICRAKARGCSQYDMWGAPDVFDESDGIWGVYRFKRGFGGEVRQGIGAYDYPVRPRLYQTFTQTLPQARSLLRKLRGQAR